MSIQKTGQYGYQAAINAKQYDKYTLAKASIRITPKNTVSKDSLTFSQKGIENIMAYTQEDMKVVDGNLPYSKADGTITLGELEHHFKDGFEAPTLNGFARQRAQQFMLAFDQGNGKGGKADGKLTLDELTARQIMELNPRAAFSQVIASEKAESPIQESELTFSQDELAELFGEMEPNNADAFRELLDLENASKENPVNLKNLAGLSSSPTELALNASKIHDNQATAGISTSEKRAFLANQFEFDAKKTGLAAKQVLDHYQLSNLATNKFNMLA